MSGCVRENARKGRGDSGDGDRRENRGARQKRKGTKSKIRHGAGLKLYTPSKKDFSVRLNCNHHITVTFSITVYNANDGLQHTFGSVTHFLNSIQYAKEKNIFLYFLLLGSGIAPG